MSLFLGLDTSNYTTSVALLNTQNGQIKSVGKLLPVSDGKLGLRQSDAVFNHVKALPQIFEELAEKDLKEVCAIGVSTRPRPVEGSYMPCFNVGIMAAKILGTALGVPVREFSHQEGHIAAVLYASNKMQLLKKTHLAWHLSGGTTELTYVKPGKNCGLDIEKIGGTTDISAGQLIDRTGVAIGLGFPAGKAMDELACRSDSREKFGVKVNNMSFSLSGMENKAKEKMEGGESAENIAGFVVNTVSDAVYKATAQAREKFGDLPVVLSGGVAGNTMLRRALSEFNPVCADAKFSSDNALGAAVLASVWQE